MYRVVLIDDEQIILKGLSKVVKWADFRCAVAGTAGSAAQGTALIREVRPDIVFTDIRMPDQDGLTMLAGLRSEFPEMRIAVLTGYRDFACAQEAIRLGVTRFLLKPSKMDEIHEALRAMTAQLDGRRAGEVPPEEDAGNGNFIVRQAVAYMEGNYARKLTLQDVADHCFVSQWHLSKLINKHMEKSFYDLLNSIRVEAAKRLLEDPKLKIGEIVELVGCSDGAQFARIFKKAEGVSANQYRNRGK